jgi:hypothetical protein
MNRLQKEAFSMDTRAVRAWVMYDWANSAFSTTVMDANLFFSTSPAAIWMPPKRRLIGDTPNPSLWS